MAFGWRQGDIDVAFRDDHQLQQYVLTDVTSTGRVLGTGSYGSVEEVLYKHLVCAGKKLHETLIDVENEGVLDMVGKYLRECQLMSGLRHPNITQFLGLCFLPGTQLPLLVTERLETSLDDLLEHMPNLPLSLKRSVLENVAGGLLYLHDRNPPIIHRDLTAKNILLTSSLIAKITDMGNSRIVNLGPSQMARTLSKIPGTLVYMPPEAMDDNHCYGPSLDVFSFGHLALYTLIQIFPGNLLSSTFVNPDGPNDIQARSELERRRNYIEILEALTSQHRTLVQLVKQCLHNVPDQRPSTEQLLTRLQGMRVEVEGEYGGGALKVDLMKAKLTKEVKVKHRRIEEQKERLDTLTGLLEERERLNRELLEEKDQQIAVKEAEITSGNERNQQLQVEIEERNREVQQQRNELEVQRQHLQDQIQMLEEQLNERITMHQVEFKTKVDEIQHLHDVLRTSDEENRQLQDQLQALNRLLGEKEEQLEAKNDEIRNLHDLVDTKDEQAEKLKEMEDQLVRQRDELETKDAQMYQQRSEIGTKDILIEQQRNEIMAKDDEIGARVDQIRQHVDDVEAKRYKIQEQESTIHALEIEVEDVQEALKVRENEPTVGLQDKEAENSRLQEELRECQGLLERNKVSSLAPGHELTFDWRCGPKMHYEEMGDYEMGGYIQSVMINGSVYVGGGKASKGKHDAVVVEYSSGKWSQLPPYKPSFAMAAVKRQLVLVGGEERGQQSKKLAVWSLDTKRWTHPDPDMITARSHCSAIAFKEWLIVAGGKLANDLLSSVEVLNTDTKQWRAGPPTPIPWHSMKTATVGSVGYFMGGDIPESSAFTTNVVYSLSLSDLRSQLQMGNSHGEERVRIWKELPKHPLNCSSPLSTGQSLLTLGGVDKEDLLAVTDIYLYKPHATTEVWVKVGDLLTPRCNCTCVAIKEVLIAGGFNDVKLKRVDIMKLQ